MTERDKFVDRRRPRPTVPDGDAVLTRSEEELWSATYRRETQRARLTRYVETETVTQTVEVRREQVRVEYEPIAAAEPGQPAAGSAADGNGDGDRWMTLYDEEVVVTTRRVPRERVRLRTHTITEDHEISEVLRKEQVEVNHARGSRSLSRQK